MVGDVTGGGRGELLGSYFREGTGRAGMGADGVGAEEPSDLGMDGGLPSGGSFKLFT